MAETETSMQIAPFDFAQDALPDWNMHLFKRALRTLAGNPSRKGRKELKNAKNSLANFVPLRPLRENPVLLRRAFKS